MIYDPMEKSKPFNQLFKSITGIERKMMITRGSSKQSSTTVTSVSVNSKPVTRDYQSRSFTSLFDSDHILDAK